MKTLKIRYPVSVLAGAFVFASCGGGDGGVGPEEPDPGEIIVSFNSSISTIGAVQLFIPVPSGATTTAFTVAGGYNGFTKSVTGGTRVVVYGTFTNGDVFRFTVPDRRQLSIFTPTREAAADRTSFALYAGTDFTVDIRAAPKQGGLPSVRGWVPMADIGR